MNDQHDDRGDVGELAAQDQADAAIEDARQRFEAEGPSQTAPHGTVPAVRQLQQMLASCARTVSRQCPHLPARGLAPVNWMPEDRDTWYCDACAERVMDRWRRDGYRQCDLCGASLASEPHPVLLHTRLMCVLIRAVVCPACAPASDGG